MPRPYEIKSFIESETLGAGPLCMRINFEADVTSDGVTGMVVCWDEDGTSYDFWTLPNEDREKILELCKNHYERTVQNEREF